MWRGGGRAFGGAPADGQEGEEGGSRGGSKYLVVHKSLTFYGAQDQCRRYGGYLVHVNSLREQVFLEDFVSLELALELGLSHLKANYSEL